MKLQQLQSFEIADADQQFHRIVMLASGTVVGFFTRDDACFLKWFTAGQLVVTKVDLVAFEIFETPTLFHLQGYVGLYSAKNDYIVVYHEAEKEKAIQIPITNSLPTVKFPNVERSLGNYRYAGNTDSTVVPFLYCNSSLLAVFLADLQVDIPARKAEWINLKYWNNAKQVDLEKETFDKPAKSFAILHALNHQGLAYAYGIGDRDAGYLKPGMDFSDLVIMDDRGKIQDTLFSLGRLYKESKKGGKECIFSSSGEFAILTPAFKSDDWKNKQKLFHLASKQLIDVELPKALSNHRIIDHHNGTFLLADHYVNLIFANTKSLVICSIL